MTQPPQATVRYSIDRDDRLVCLSDTWLEFARENEAPELTNDLVLGRSLWSFVSGRETRDLYELLFDWVRSRGTEISVPFRCDSPDTLRFMRLRLSPSEAEGVNLAAVLDRKERRSHLRLLERMAPRADYTFETCSFCRRIFVFGAWLEPEEAVARLGWLESQNPPGLSEGVCEACARTCRELAPPEAC